MKLTDRPMLLSIALALFGLALPPDAHACKPCPGNSIEVSLNQSKGLVLGKVKSVQQSGVKRGPGEAALQLEVERWIIPPEGSTAGSKPKPLKSIEVQVRWDGICVTQPLLPATGERALFFLAEWNQGQGKLTGYCSSPVLRMTDGKVLIPAEAGEDWGLQPILLRTFESKIKKLRKPH